VDGPASNVVVPLFATFALQANAYGPASSAFATLSVSGTRNDFFERAAADEFSSSSSILVSLPFGLEMGHTGTVSMGIGGVSFSDFAVDAYADPFIFVDPAFLASNPGYTVRTSDGIGNTAPVSVGPEPETYAMLLVGLGLLATTRTRLFARSGSEPT
jgi:hypothetical protein